jgi:hypothetical protein
MPTMPRIPGKGKKVAWKILGVPPNISFKPDQRQKKINQRLIFEESTRVR